MVFPFVDLTDFKDEFRYTAVDLDVDPSRFDALLERALKTASERVEDMATLVPKDEWRDAATTDDVPFVARESVIRLARARLERIMEDGLEQESLASGVSYSYRPPKALRDDVRDTLDEADLRAGDDDFVFNA